MHLTPNAQLLVNSRDRFILYPSPVDPRVDAPQTTSQPWNNFSLTNQGQNIVQGSIDKIQVAEVRFPYDIPNVVEQYTDSFQISYGTGFVTHMIILIPQGFYTGEELEGQIQSAINAECASQTPAITGADIPTVTYNSADNYFEFENAGTTNVYRVEDTGLISNPNGSLGQPANSGSLLTKSLLSMMGLTPTGTNSIGLSDASFVLQNVSVYKGATAPLIFTEYVDIVSKALCGNVFVADGSTQQRGGFRKDILCRLYIADENSAQTGYVYNQAGDPELAVVGTRPFVIHRQFQNAKVIPNNLLNSLNTVDIQVYADNGQLVPLPAGSPGEYQEYRNFQITLNVFETDRTNTVNVPSSGYGNY